MDEILKMVLWGQVAKEDAEGLFRSIPDPASARKSLSDITQCAPPPDPSRITKG